MNALDDLRQCPDVATLKPALQKLCEKFGKIARLDILTAMHEGTKQAICFLRLDAPDKEVALMKALGVGRFGGEIVFVVNLDDSAIGKGASSSS
ncbi:RNA-binding protein [Polaromonas sp.]|uniref:RNA-binding protein n=1 Tax=Polaromonas sp. TaxID=1869339 RepID=UPI0017F87BC7|nr:RNA-binding protein [Polaromonas sp.]NMM07536.1 RNA-binding protein [Polaromonas sp.]